MKKIQTIHRIIRRDKPVALPRQTAKFADNCMHDLYAEFLELARIITEKRAHA